MSLALYLDTSRLLVSLTQSKGMLELFCDVLGILEMETRLKGH